LDQTTYMTQEPRTQIFKFLTQLTQPVEKTVNLQGFMEVYKPRNINVLVNVDHNSMAMHLTKSL
jgi:hypothetical protein